MNPLFVHDPRRGESLRDWFDLDGNPDVESTWTTSTLQYVDADGAVQLLSTPLTPAEFALGEVRFKKQFRRLAAAQEEAGVPIHAYVDLPAAQREGRVPFVYATDDDRRLIKVACSPSIVALVEDRRRYWHTLQYLAGIHEDRLTALHRADLEALQARYEEATAARETSLDDIARAMADLATASAAPAGGPGLGGFGFGGPGLGGSGGVGASGAPGAVAGGAAAPSSAAPVATLGVPAGAPVWLDPADQARCTDCGTCYQELPQFFEKATVVIDGEARTVARMIPGAVEKVQVTPEIAARIERVKATCDAEIIR